MNSCRDNYSRKYDISILDHKMRRTNILQRAIRTADGYCTVKVTHDISYLKEEKEEIIEIGRENLEFLLAHGK